MSIVESSQISVLNYSDSLASFPTYLRPEGYLFEPQSHGEPFVNVLTYAEIRVVNSQSSIFRDGILKFDPEVEKEVYEKLGIHDWEDILSDTQIRTIILKPTAEGLKKLIKIMSAAMFERVRGTLIQLDNTGMFDISGRVKNVINERYREIYQGVRISKIEIQSNGESAPIEKQALSEDELAKIKEELKAQILAEIAAETKQAEVIVESKTVEVITPENVKVDTTKVKVK